MQSKEKVDLKKLTLNTIKLNIKGTSPYLPEPMDMAVVERYDKIKSKKSYDKDDIPEEEKVKAKLYFTRDEKIGIPSRAFYKSMIRASSYLIEKKDGGMRNIREGLTILGDILPLKYKSKEVLTHWGRTSGRSASPRKIMRNAFNDWEVELSIQYNKSNLSAEQIINVLNWAGFHIGVGGFRKENSGNFGSFTVCSVTEKKQKK